MKSLPILTALFVATGLAVSVSTAYSEEIAPPGKVLDVGGDNVEKFETSSSMIGFRNTLIFYTFKDQKAVLRLTIDNKNKDFPISATIYAFADDVTADGLKKWLNNQHSDGLFPDVPTPTATHPVPSDSCKAISHKLSGTSEAPNGKFEDYTVTYEVRDVPPIEGILIKDFTADAKVRVKKG